jgi:RNA polymerase sigma-70 factor (ECF subfamily)
LYQRTIAYVYTVVKRYVSNESDYKDVIQEIYARVFLRLDTFDPQRGEFKAWLRRLTINQCFQHNRQGRSPRLFVPVDTVPEEEAGVTENKVQLTKAEIEEYLRHMPEGYRQVFLLVVIDDYTHQEVAELLGITPETSRSQLSRAKNWLKKKVTTDKQKILASGF